MKTVRLPDLKPHPKNPRKHPDKLITKLITSIKEFGFTSPVLIDADNRILAGHASWYEIGDGIIRSVIDGMRGAADDLANEAAQAAAAALSAARGAVVPSAIPVSTNGVTGSVPQGSQSGTGGTMTQVTINSPKPLSEKETAREFEKVSQKLALAVKS